MQTPITIQVSNVKATSSVCQHLSAQCQFPAFSSGSNSPDFLRTLFTILQRSWTSFEGIVPLTGWCATLQTFSCDWGRLVPIHEVASNRETPESDGIECKVEALENHDCEHTRCSIYFRNTTVILGRPTMAKVYQPTLSYPKWTVDGHEQQLQINYLSQSLATRVNRSTTGSCILTYQIISGYIIKLSSISNCIG